MRTPLRFSLRILLLILVFSCCPAVPSRAGGPPDLLIPVVQAGTMALASGGQAAGARLPGADSMEVTVDFSVVDPSDNGPLEISLALPRQTVLIRKEGVEVRKGGGYTWRGKVFGSELSSVVLTIDRQAIFGSIDFDGLSFSLETVGGSYVITRQDSSRRGPLGEDGVPPARDRNSARPQAAKPPSTQAATAVAQTLEDGSRIDVLVLYTAAFQTDYEPNQSAKIQSLVDIANTAYINSGVSTQLNLVGEVLYDNAGAAEGVDIGTALDLITDSAQVATLRQQYQADLVSLVRVYEQGDYCGLAWLMDDVDSPFAADWAFSVVEVWSAGWFYCDETTFAHELGHNMGCAHDRPNASLSGAFPYSYGYSVAGIGTIMSYEGETIPYFSTPLETYGGNPIGIASGPDAADNARTINETRTTVANFVVNNTVDLVCETPASITVPASDPDGGFTVSWGASATAGVTYVLEEATNSSFSAGRRTAYSGPDLSAPINGLSLGAKYYYRVQATRNGYTDSGWRAGGNGCSVPGTAAARPDSITVPGSDANGSFTVSWAASATPGVTYTLQEATDSAFKLNRRKAYTGTGVSKDISNRTLGAKYYYRVQAKRTGYTASSWRAGKGCAVPGTAAARPGAMTVPASDANGSYTVSWGASATPGATYVLQEATDSAFTANKRTAYSGSGLSTPITERPLGATYYYRVQAKSAGYTVSNWRAGGGCAVP